jgi:NAD+ kinase
LRAGIFTNLYKDTDLSVTRLLVETLDKNGVDWLIHRDVGGVFAGNAVFDETTAADIDVLITLGGDGTILRIAEYAARTKTPILGINLGFTGFLTECEPEQIGAVIRELGERSFHTEDRTLLRADFGEGAFHALNDVVVLRDGQSRMPELEVEIGGELVDRYHCDGFIVSTPTGSTAYSLSAGGPIISPHARALALTPITPHSLHSRPLVVSEDEQILVRIGGQSVATVISADGAIKGTLPAGGVLRVEKSAYTVSFVRLGTGRGFYSKLLSKLNKWGMTER